ncbi:hypothetical protein QTN25_007709 [Entamoeba marina]
MDPYTYRLSQFFTSVKISNLDYDVTAESLTELFDHCGDIVSIRISKPFEGHRWAIINFTDKKSVERAEYLSGSTFCNRVINVYGCALTPVDLDETERFYYGRSLPIGKKEKKGVSDTAVEIVADGKCYLIDAKEKVENFFAEHKFGDSMKKAATTVDEKLHLSKMFSSDHETERTEDLTEKSKFSNKMDEMKQATVESFKDFNAKVDKQVEKKTRTRKGSAEQQYSTQQHPTQQHPTQQTNDPNIHEELKVGDIISTYPYTEIETPSIIDMNLSITESVESENKKGVEDYVTVK